MKKRVIVGIVIVLVIIIAAVALFSGKDEPDEPVSSSGTTVSQQETQKDNTPDIVNGTKNPDKLVRVTLPLLFYDAKKKGDTEGFIHAGNYEKISVDEKDKTFTVTMKSITHDFMLSSVGIQVIKSIVSLLDNKDYPYVKQLGNYNSDFSEIELLVDAKEYQAAENKDEIAPFVASCGIFYQVYSTENSYSCKVLIKSVKSGKIIDEYVAQQNNGNMG